MIKYAIKILTSNNEPSYYCKGSGDPSRTSKLEFAQLYEYYESAKKALNRLSKKYPNRSFLVVKVEVSVTELDIIHSCHCGAENFRDCICFDSKQIGYRD